MQHTNRRGAGADTGSANRYRHDIEGLRAVAALLVAVYHVWLGRVSGGVDVFFVVAGFMVTTTLLGHVHRYGRVRAGLYLSRLLKRLLPNSLLVLTVVAVATMVWIPVTRRSQVLTEISASALYYENWALIDRSVDYLQRDFTSSPVQHYWAMSIQGQFYLIWLVLFVVVALVARGAFRHRLTLVVGTIVVLSFGYSVYLTAADQPVAYFHTSTRTWEFGTGALVALGAARAVRPASGARAWVLGWVGLLAIVSCGLVLSVGSSFPGWIALWPVLGAVLLLAADSSDSQWSASRLLASRPLVSLGSVSYAIYLWHWPLLVFFLILTRQQSVGLGEGALIVAATIVLSYGSTRIVERPARTSSVEHRRPWLIPVVGLAAAACVAAGSGAVNGRIQPVEPAAVPADAPRHPGPRVAGPGSTVEELLAPNTDSPVPDVPALPLDTADVYDLGCHQTPRGSELAVCDLGDPGADRTMALVGGSHSAQWQPALTGVAEREGWRLESMTKSGCRHGAQFEAAGPDAADAEESSCREWNTAALEHLVSTRPDLVVTTATIVSGGQESTPESYVTFWRELAEHDIPVLAIRDTPRPPVDIAECMSLNGVDSRECDFPRRAEVEVPVMEGTEALPDTVSVADLSDWFCAPDVCPAVVGDVVVYYDNSHVTRSYMRLLAPVLPQAAPLLD